MREIILAHRVADNLLEGKVSALLQQYAHVQSAFRLVKLRTVVIYLFRRLLNRNYSLLSSFPMSRLQRPC